MSTVIAPPRQPRGILAISGPRLPAVEADPETWWDRSFTEACLTRRPGFNCGEPVDRRTFGIVPYVDSGFGSAYYEVHGQGEPVVLLHGGAFGFGAGLLSPQIADLTAAGFTVYTPERSGHGRTPDVERPYSYEAMADETAAFIDTVVGARAHLVGWSDGAVVGVLIAMRRPELVDRLVAMGSAFNSDGDLVDWPEFVRELRADPYPSVVKSYELLSPDGPEHFGVFWEKMTELWLHPPQIDLPDLSVIESPVLLVQGDQEEVRVEHTAAAARAMPNGRFAILPGTHLLPMESPQLLNPLIVAFLRGEAPPAPHEVGS